MAHTLFVPNIQFRITGFYSAFDVQWNSSFTFLGESHNFWEIVTVLSGEVEIVEDGRIYQLGGGQMICHAPNEFHRIKSAGGTDPHVLIMSFAHEGQIPEQLSTGIFHLSTSLLEEYREIFRLFHPFVTQSLSGIPDETQNISAYVGLHRLEAFLIRLSQTETTNAQLSSSASAAEYRKLVRTMRACVTQNLTLEQLSQAHHISQSYIKKLFHTYTGVGAMTYFATLRVREIQRRLELGESLNEIAEQMNFSSTAYLSSFFKKHTGMTPAKYKCRTQ